MTDDNLPFRHGTKIFQVFSVLSDLEWHCGKHELPGTQPAKAIQIIRQNGYEVENRTISCKVCNDRTVHRRLIALQPIRPSSVRLPLPESLRRRILSLYKNIESITLRELPSNLLEIDHKFPQVRWSKDEQFNVNMSNEEILKRFQLLTRENNLWKSRYCERCKETSIRGKFISINFFAVGNQEWDKSIPDDDERGCFGCFWYDPRDWRSALNALIDSHNSDDLDAS